MAVVGTRVDDPVALLIVTVTLATLGRVTSSTHGDVGAETTFAPVAVTR